MNLRLIFLILLLGNLIASSIHFLTAERNASVAQIPGRLVPVFFWQTEEKPHFPAIRSGE
jgi:hypothetical protein